MAIQQSDGTMQSVHEGDLLFVVESEISANLADLVSVVGDLERAMEYGRAFEERVDDAGLRNALFEAAIVAYARSFREGRAAIKRREAGKGVARLKATKYLSLLSGELTDAHEELLSLRDKHVGHRVENESSVVISEFGIDGNFLSVSPMIWGLGASTGPIRNLIEIVEILIPAISTEIDELIAALTQTLSGARLTGGQAMKYDPNERKWKVVRVGLD